MENNRNVRRPCEKNAHHPQSGCLTSLWIISQLASSSLLWKWTLLHTVSQVIGGDKPFLFLAFPSVRSRACVCFYQSFYPNEGLAETRWCQRWDLWGKLVSALSLPLTACIRFTIELFTFSIFFIWSIFLGFYSLTTGMEDKNKTKSGFRAHLSLCSNVCLFAKWSMLYYWISEWILACS